MFQKVNGQFPEKNRAVLYFNHIPKTAGTSLRNSLERLFPCSLHNDYWFTEQYLGDTSSNIAKYKLLSGHLGMVPPLLSARQHHMIVFLRDPIERAFSHYCHIKSDDHSPWKFLIKTLSFEDFLFSPIAEGELLNFQTRHLGLSSIVDYFEIKDQILNRGFITKKCRSSTLLEEAKRNLDKSWFVGLASNFNSSVVRLGHQLGVPLDADAKLNVARVSSVMPDLSNSAKSRLAWLTEFDQELWEYAQLRVTEENNESFCTQKLDLSFFKAHVDFTSGFVGGGWHPVEIRSGSGYCWSYSNSPWMAFVASWPSNSRLTARLATWVAEDIASIILYVNGTRVSYDLFPADSVLDGNFMYLSAIIPSDLVDELGMIKVHFCLPRTIQPKTDFGGCDERILGVYANWVRLLPDTGHKLL